MSIPVGATHVVADIHDVTERQKIMNGKHPYRKKEGNDWFAFVDGAWLNVWFSEPHRYQRLNKPWSGPEDGLPKIGSVVELWKGSDKGTHVEIIAHFNASADLVAVYVPVEGYRHVNQAISSCFKPIITPEQLAAEKRETAIAEMAKVLPRAKHECWTCNPDGSVKPYENTYEILGLLVDAGFKREGV